MPHQPQEGEATLVASVRGEPVEKRGAILGAVFGNDSALHGGLEARLATPQAAADSLTGIAVTASAETATTQAPAASEEAEGSLLGRYELVEKLRERGFGAVWLAEQKVHVRRKVALTIVMLATETKAVVARFDAGRQALAMMDPPNTIHTQTQQFIGTPAYMSPEQAEMTGLDIETRNDTYHLGVLLYERGAFERLLSITERSGCAERRDRDPVHNRTSLTRHRLTS